MFVLFVLDFLSGWEMGGCAMVCDICAPYTSLDVVMRWLQMHVCMPTYDSQVVVHESGLSYPLPTHCPLPSFGFGNPETQNQQEGKTNKKLMQTSWFQTDFAVYLWVINSLTCPAISAIKCQQLCEVVTCRLPFVEVVCGLCDCDTSKFSASDHNPTARNEVKLHPGGCAPTISCSFGENLEENTQLNWEDNFIRLRVNLCAFRFLIRDLFEPQSMDCDFDVANASSIQNLMQL